MTVKARMTIDVDEDFRNEVKSRASRLGKKLKDYVVEALELKIQQDIAAEDKYLGKLADKAKKEGFLSAEDSLSLIEKIKNA